ncbi:MAG TPA: mechanosensitive ion channel domain-containing protein [Oceanobacillus sp.]|nr:mechanosensitive ion channel domain-containing protein [Oceanobacillus sp.]
MVDPATQINELLNTARGIIPAPILALIIFIVFWFLSVIFKGIVKRYGDRTRLNEDVRDLLARLIRVTILVVGIITALGTIGIDVTAMVAGLGLTGFALGFALQDIISNMLAGILILMNRPFRRGNYIKVADKEGTVIDMDLRYTSLQKDNLKILIPNSTLFKEAITIVTPTPSAPSMPPTNAP